VIKRRVNMEIQGRKVKRKIKNKRKILAMDPKVQISNCGNFLYCPFKII